MFAELLNHKFMAFQITLAKNYIFTCRRLVAKTSNTAYRRIEKYCTLSMLISLHVKEHNNVQGHRLRQY